MQSLCLVYAGLHDNRENLHPLPSYIIRRIQDDLTCYCATREYRQIRLLALVNHITASKKYQNLNRNLSLLWYESKATLLTQPIATQNSKQQEPVKIPWT